MSRKADMDYMRQNRTFQAPGGEIDGRSVVFETRPMLPNDGDGFSRDAWPCCLNDFLQKYIGKMAQLEYLMSNGRTAVQKGKIAVVGSNFVGIQPMQTGNLFLVELSSVKSINVINFNKGQRGYPMR